MLPTAFLPVLPKAQYTLHPLDPREITSLTGILRELYLPPVHGGLNASDTFYDDNDKHERGQGGEAAKAKQRRFSKGLVESIGTLDLSGIGRQHLTGPTLGDATPKAAASGAATPIPITRSGSHTPACNNDGSDSDSDLSDDEDEDEGDGEHLDAFEREWAQKWLQGVVRRAQTWIEQTGDGLEVGEADPDGYTVKEVEAVLKDATAVLAVMAGTGAAGSLTRHLLFPIAPTLVPGLEKQQSSKVSDAISNAAYSPTTRTFLASLATRTRARSSTVGSMSSAASGSSTLSASPTASTTSHPSPSSPRAKRKRRRPPAIPVLLHDAPISDHLDVGVQTWGSAILLGRELAVRPEKFGLLPRTPAEEEMFNKRGTRVLELGAGTGLLGILCRKLLDLHSSTREDQVREHLVLATDFLPSVLDNLKLCVDLNFPSAPSATSSSTTSGGVDIAKLDWVTFPAFAERYHAGKSPSSKPAALPRDSINSDSRSNDLAKADTNQLRYPLERTIARPDAPEEVEDDAANPMLPYMDAPFDLVLVSDCVYDPTHAEMIRNVAGWALRPPNPDIEGDIGGTMHILSPLRPTFAPELESIDTFFPVLSSYSPLETRRPWSFPSPRSENRENQGPGEGLGWKQGLRIGTRGQGKRSVRGRKGEGRVDEVGGYWWWEVGWG